MNIKWIYWIVILSIIWVGVRVWWSAYSVMVELAQFQIDIYSYFIKFSVSVEDMGWRMNQNLAELFSRLWSEKAKAALESGKYTEQLNSWAVQQRIATYTSKVIWFCRIVWILIWIWVYTILRRIVFTIDTHFQTVYKFITRK